MCLCLNLCTILQYVIYNVLQWGIEEMGDRFGAIKKWIETMLSFVCNIWLLLFDISTCSESQLNSTWQRWNMEQKNVAKKCFIWALEVVTVIEFIKTNKKKSYYEWQMTTKRIQINQKFANKLYCASVSDWIELNSRNPNLSSCNRPFSYIFFFGFSQS